LLDLNKRNSSRWAGKRGEVLACRFLEDKGYTLIERNYRTRDGEIDLVMRGEGPLAGALVFIEVKLRRGTGFGDPLEAVTPKKQTKVRLMAEQYLAKKGEDFTSRFGEMRFDVVGILLLPGADKPQVRHVEDAF
jgi:putative endonuclease